MKTLILLSLIGVFLIGCTNQLDPDLISIIKLKNENEKLIQENKDLRDLFQGATDSLYILRQKKEEQEMIEEKEENRPLSFL